MSCWVLDYNCAAAAAVVAGGEFPPVEWARPRLQQASRVVAADSGWELCQHCQVVPWSLVGDLDSLDPALQRDLPELAGGIHRYSQDKDQSDLQLALERLAQHYCGPVDILAALGGRLDHALFNIIAILEKAETLGLQARIISPTSCVLRIQQQTLELIGWQSHLCSILPLSEQLQGVDLEGFRYPLQQGTLLRHETRGLSNVVVEERAHIRARQGAGLVILSPS